MSNDETVDTGSSPVERGVRRLRLAPLLDYARGEENVVYDIEDRDEVGCYHCIAQGCHDSYRRGEAFLAGPGHSPLDGNANYICRQHLDSDAVISDA